MSKRYINSNGSHQLNNNSKKPKLDEDEVWEEEEIDDEALDKCFELATQAAQEQSTNNQTILPPYQAFINPISFTSSTQAVVNNPQISKEKELELVISKLKQLNAEKDGEISILRSKIKDNTVTHQVEQQRTTSEWREKYQSASKEVKTVKSDLDFKNLEIANLKQQLANQRRINLDATVNEPIVLVPKPLPAHQEKNPSIKDELQSNNIKKEIILDLISPLKSLSSISFTDNHMESHLIKNNKKFYEPSRLKIHCLKNKETCNELNFHHKCPQIDNKTITIENVYSDILSLANNRFDIEAVDKIIAVALILLKDLNDYLLEYGSNLRTEDIQQADFDYLQGIVSNDFQLGIQGSKLLRVISQLILYNQHTADFICYDKMLKLPSQLREYALLIPHRNGAIQNDYYFLRLVLTIVENIAKYRLDRQTNDFLIAATILLKNIALLVNGNPTSKPINDEIFCNLSKKLVSTKPRDEMIEQITFLLKNCSLNKTFIEYLFKSDPNKESLMVRSKAKTVLLFNENACCMCVLACQLKNYIIKIEKLPLNVCYNMLSFMYNIVKKSHWIHYENADKVCSCLLQIYRLEIQFLHKALTNFNKYCKEGKNTETLNEWKAFFEDQLIKKLLNQINFISYELILKKPLILAQYKEIERYLISQEKFNFVQLNVSESETLPTISPEAIKFEDIFTDD